jgi:hypothetical protein
MRGSRLWVKSERGFHDVDDQRVVDLANRPTQDSTEAVVIGAGPAGLAVARQLDHQHGIKTLVLDRAAAPAISWHASIRCARPTTRMVDSTAGWAASDRCRPRPVCRT